MMKDLLRIADLSSADLELLLDQAASAAADPHQRADLLRGDTVALYFATPSTRTRVAFQTAVAHLGGVPLALGPAELQRARGETIQDTARVISRYVRAIVVRTLADADLGEVAAAACVPVVNALSDRHDPCQTLAGLLTLRQRWGRLAGRKLAYLGDGGNVAHSLLEAAALGGMDIAVATPYGLEPHPEVVARARALAAQHGSRVELTLNPTSAVRDADAVFTDAWLSMHDPASARAARIHVLAPFRVDRRLLAGAKPDALFLHCLPAYRGEEVTDEVIDGPRSLVLDQAANLLPIAQALLYLLLEGRLQGHTDTMTVPDDTGRLAAAIRAAIKGDAIGDQVTPAARLRSPGTGSGRVWVGRWGRTRIIRVTSDDEAIRREVVDEVLVRTLWIEPPTVTVTVQDGIVTLSGRLERKSLVSMAVHLTRRVPGVVDVVSQLSFDWDDDRPEPARVRAWAP